MRNDFSLFRLSLAIGLLAALPAVSNQVVAADTKMVQNRAVPEDQVIATVLVTAGRTTGSGFYLMTKPGASFITAKHVLFDEKGGLHAETVQLLSYSIAKNSAGTLMSLDLKALRDAKLLKVHESEDVVVINIATTDKPLDETGARELTPVAGVTLNRISPEGVWGPVITNSLKFDDVSVGNEVLLAGFPSSIGLQNIPQIDRLRPLLRRGIIAGRNEAKKTIIIDCPVFPGNSGGPVVQVHREAFQTTFQIIGLVSQFVPFDNSGWSAAVGGNATLLNSGFSVVVPMDPVLELLQ